MINRRELFRGLLGVAASLAGCNIRESAITVRTVVGLPRRSQVILRKADWIELDAVVIRVARTRLRRLSNLIVPKENDVPS